MTVSRRHCHRHRLRSGPPRTEMAVRYLQAARQERRKARQVCHLLTQHFRRGCQ